MYCVMRASAPSGRAYVRMRIRSRRSRAWVAHTKLPAYYTQLVSLAEPRLLTGVGPGGVGQAHRRVRAYEKVTRHISRSSHSTVCIM